MTKEEIAEYYSKIASITSGSQKQYYSYIAKKLEIKEVKFLSNDYYNRILSQCIQHECYRNCYKFMMSTLGRRDDLVFEYCEGELWIRNQVPIHHAWIKVTDIRTGEQWFVDPTLQSLGRLEPTDTYVSYKSFRFREFIDILTENQVHGNVFNSYMQKYLENEKRKQNQKA